MHQGMASQEHLFVLPPLRYIIDQAAAHLVISPPESIEAGTSFMARGVKGGALWNGPFLSPALRKGYVMLYDGDKQESGSWG